MAGFTIGRLAEATGTKVQTIRYYERIGLLPPSTAPKAATGFTAAEDQKRLTFIRHARELGFSIEAIRELLSLSDNPETSCELRRRHSEPTTGGSGAAPEKAQGAAGRSSSAWWTNAAMAASAIAGSSRS